MEIKKHAGKGKEKSNGKRQAKKTAETLPLFFPLFPFSSLFLSPSFPFPPRPSKRKSDIANLFHS